MDVTLIRNPSTQSHRGENNNVNKEWGFCLDKGIWENTSFNWQYKFMFSYYDLFKNLINTLYNLLFFIISYVIVFIFVNMNIVSPPGSPNFYTWLGRVLNVTIDLYTIKVSNPYHT